MRRINFSSPYIVMCIVLSMYIVKVIAKISFGRAINSPMITGDGYHNIADIFEAMIVIGAILVSRLPANGAYPFGRKNIESLFSVAVGLALLLMALKIAGESFYVLGGQFFSREAPDIPLKMGVALGFWATGITLGSALLSVVVSSYQIRVGRRTGHEALVADGRETRSDGMIEFSVFVGVCGEYLFSAPWIEYVFAMLVSYFMVRTGQQLLTQGLSALLQRSIGEDHDNQIFEIATQTHGVIEVAQLKSFRIGTSVKVIMNVKSMIGPKAHRLMKHAIVARVTDYLIKQEFSDAEFFIRFTRPETERHRIAVGLNKTGDNPMLIANTMDDMTHLVVCDMEHNKIVRATLHNLEEWGTLKTFLERKRVRTLLLFDQYKTEESEICGVPVRRTCSPLPSVLGLKV